MRECVRVCLCVFLGQSNTAIESERSCAIFVVSATVSHRDILSSCRPPPLQRGSAMDGTAHRAAPHWNAARLKTSGLTVPVVRVRSSRCSSTKAPTTRSSRCSAARGSCPPPHAQAAALR